MITDTKMSQFAETIMLQKYAHTKEDGTKETWEEIAYRVAKNVLKSVGAPKSQIDATADIIARRLFVPGGRYLWASGRAFHQVQNCLLLKAEDSREGWSSLLEKSSMALMTGAGIGVDYSAIRPEGSLIRKTGGYATGPIALMTMLNECGRGIMQGGSRRSAIWAGLNWAHADIHRFITLKNWPEEMRTNKERDFNAYATMDGTNISVQLDDEFFKAYHNDKHKKHEQAQGVYWAVVRQMLKTAEPGFSVDTGVNSGETLRNAPVTSQTAVATKQGIQRVFELVGVPTTIWTGQQWAENVIFKQTGSQVEIVEVNMTGNRSLKCDPSHPFVVERYVGKGSRRRLVSLDRIPAGELKAGDILHVSLPEHDDGHFDSNAYADSYAMGFLYGDGHFENGHAEVTICAKSKEVCSAFIKKYAHIGWTTVKEPAWIERLYFNTDHERFDSRYKEVFPFDYRTDYSFSARSFLAGLFDADGSYDLVQNRVRLGCSQFAFLRDTQRLLEWLGIQANISTGSESGYAGTPSWQLVIAADSVSEFARLIPTHRLKVEDHEAYRPMLVKVLSVDNAGTADVYCADVKVSEHTFMAEGVIIGNCTEVTSRDDSDICNLGSINMARIESLSDMSNVVDLGIAFLLAGTVYSDVPYPKVDMIRTKNRRLGLGLMGLHEWMLVRGLPYGASDELRQYMEVYAQSTTKAGEWAEKWDLSAPIKTRAIAPTGTIGIVGETTTGIEPIFCVAYKRRYAKGSIWHYQYVVDPAARRLIEAGIHPDSIEDAYVLAEDCERRVAFQSWLQGYVDHSISSTINLPSWGSTTNNATTVQDFGRMLIKYLPDLRGITCYPDGARGGQPLTPVKYGTAMKYAGEVFMESMDICDLTKGGSCGS